MHSPLVLLQEEISRCELCPRLREHCREVAVKKRRAYREWTYWGRPVPSFGDHDARVHVIGLAPGAHGANRTGRMFTGDSSGDFLYKALHATGFASQPTATHRGDGLELRGLFISASAHCAPPDNRPLPEELRRCRPYLEREIDLLRNVKVVVTLGRIAFDTYLGILRDRGVIASRAPFVFGHDSVHHVAGGQPVLIGSYHPSRQNTSTGRLTQAMLRAVFRRAAKLSR